MRMNDVSIFYSAKQTELRCKHFIIYNPTSPAFVSRLLNKALNSRFVEHVGIFLCLVKSKNPNTAIKVNMLRPANGATVAIYYYTSWRPTHA